MEVRDFHIYSKSSDPCCGEGIIYGILINELKLFYISSLGTHSSELVK